MTFSVHAEKLRFNEEHRVGVTGKPVLRTGACKDSSPGQAFALSAGLNGTASVGVHFNHRYVDRFDMVQMLRDEGVNTFPVQADITNMCDQGGDLHLYLRTNGQPATEFSNLQLGLTEKGYSLGRE